MPVAKPSLRSIASAAALVACASGSLASAQDYSGGTPPQPYQQGQAYGQAQGDGYRQGTPAPGYAGGPGYGAPDPGYDAGPPPGYDGSQPPPPPPGYQPVPGYEQQAQEDQRYEAYAEDWAQRYCTKAPNNAGAGAVIGGLFGALLGSGLAGRHDRGGGAVLGGVAGAAGGAAIGSTSRNDTSPGCPPGYVVRGGAPAFYYAGPTPYIYAAPAWYRPWVFYGGRWTYRPYPYHAYYYHRYGYNRPYFGGRPYRRPY